MDAAADTPPTPPLLLSGLFVEICAFERKVRAGESGVGVGGHFNLMLQLEHGASHHLVHVSATQQQLLPGVLGCSHSGLAGFYGIRALIKAAIY